MRLHSDGFSILEILIAVLLLAIIGGTSLRGLSQSVLYERRTLGKLYEIEVGRSILEEYLVIRDAENLALVDDQISAVVTERPWRQSFSTRFDQVFEITEVSVAVFRVGRSNEGATITQLVARRSHER